MLGKEPTHPVMMPTEMVCLDSAGLLSLPLKFDLFSVIMLHADSALTPYRKRYLTFLKTQTPETSTYIYEVRREFDPFHSATALLSTSLPALMDNDNLRVSKFGAFSAIRLSAHSAMYSGGHRVFAWIDGYSDGEDKGIKLWSDNGPNYIRKGDQQTEGEDQGSCVCMVGLPKNVVIGAIERIVLDEIHGRIFLILRDSSITILSFV